MNICALVSIGTNNSTVACGEVSELYSTSYSRGERQNIAGDATCTIVDIDANRVEKSTLSDCL